MPPFHVAAFATKSGPPLKKGLLTTISAGNSRRLSFFPNRPALFANCPSALIALQPIDRPNLVELKASFF